MRIVILHDDVRPGDRADALDTLVQVDQVRAALIALRHEVSTLAVSLNLQPLIAPIAQMNTDVVFNLVESMDGEGCWIHVAPAFVEGLGCSMTGCSSAAIGVTSNKLSAKLVMARAGIPTPQWVTRYDDQPTEGKWIIKAIWEHASIGMSGASVVDASRPNALANAQDVVETGFDVDAFAERFIDGREFNLSILEIDGTPTVLPVAEIEFVEFAPGAPRIVDYAAKWDATSHAYHHTPRKYDFPPADETLIRELRALALRCWDVFGLRGYARVDFRVDEAGRPWVLEVNTNPCLSDDAGFVAAAHRANLTQRDVVRHIVETAQHHAQRTR